MKNNLKYVLIPLIILLIIAIPFINFKAFSLRSYTNEFEILNAYIIDENLKSGIVFSKDLNKVGEFPIIAEAVNKSQLCAIINHSQKGIVYKFQCSNNNSDKFIFNDER